MDSNHQGHSRQIDERIGFVARMLRARKPSRKSTVSSGENSMTKIVMETPLYVPSAWRIARHHTLAQQRQPLGPIADTSRQRQDRFQMMLEFSKCDSLQ